MCPRARALARLNIIYSEIKCIFDEEASVFFLPNFRNIKYLYVTFRDATRVSLSRPLYSAELG